ncbi:hypothetical protein RUM44_010122 [Polyplax serrata]|uniref:BRCT domain-containing protein n=1 Tax=Polyplax serrata TaxID=468196 RepID=A0ABR1AUM0_POLSC
MTQVDALKIYFVLPKDDGVEKDCSQDMRLASDLVVKCGGNRLWINPSDCTDIHPQKKDVFVFDKFEGVAFEALKKKSSKILGVRCLITCLTNGTTIPPSPHPVYMEPMRNLFVASSGFDQATKKLIQEKVQYMGGHYDNALRSIVTHLVAHNNLSSKAIHAYKNNMKIMKLSWIEDVWQKNLVNDINGDDEIFHHHLSPLFNNLNVTTSGISKREKDALKVMIQNHGGNFMGTLEGNFTNILLVTKPEGEKFRVAQSWNIPCIKPAWVQDCIEAKAILLLKPYVVEAAKPKASTPNKENCTVNFSANFTANLSIIKNPGLQSNGDVDETASVLNAINDFHTQKLSTQKLATQTEILKVNSKNDKTVKSSHFNIINNVLLKNLKEAGQFLDGLNIYLYGFQSEDSEKLKRILNKGGAIRFDEMSESVTHVIAGKNYDQNLAKFAKLGAYILSVDWLVESMKLKGKANESKFLLVNNAPNSSEPPSPMSKKGAQLLSEQEGKIQKPSFQLEANDMKKLSQLDELLCRYNASQPDVTATNNAGVTVTTNTTTTTTSTNNNKQDSSCSRTSDLGGDDFFSGLTFFLSSDLSEEEIKYLEDLIIERKGQIVGKRDFGVPDFAIVPAIGALLTGVIAKEVVNIYYVKDCCVEGCVLSPRYYHQPVDCIKNAEPLKNCVISVSNYIQGEREFMEMMIEALGGVAQSLLARKPKQGALKSTHLVCAEPQGQKYEGAVRWGLPVVHHDWLLKCAALGTHVSEKSYLVGDSTMPDNKSISDVTNQVETKSRNTPTTVNYPSTKSPFSESVEKMPPPPTAQTRSADGEIPSVNPYQTTPVHNAIARVKATETPKNMNSPDPNRTVTPISPYGAFYGRGSPSPTTRKRLWKWMNQGAEFPVDPPTKPIVSESEGTPISEMISRHLEMLKRKPEDLPPDSPIGAPFKRLNLDLSETDNGSKASVDSGLKKMKLIEENFTRNGIKSPSSLKKSGEPEGRQMVIVSESQAHTEVGWEDPVEKDLVLDNLEKAKEIEVKPKVFMLSCITKQLEEIRELLEESGGVVSSLPYYDKKATHLITGNLTRAEKLMGSIAAGLWVLHPSYVDALKQTKNVHSVPEEDYEWGSPKQRFRLKLMSSNATDFAICSHAWRLCIKEGQPPAFNNVKILLHVSQSKQDSFKRLIEAGRGTVVTGKAPHYQNVEADICVYEASSTEDINFASLAKRNIPCVALVYISDILLKVTDALDKNLVPEFRQHWKGTK